MKKNYNFPRWEELIYLIGDLFFNIFAHDTAIPAWCRLGF